MPADPAAMPEDHYIRASAKRSTELRRNAEKLFALMSEVSSGAHAQAKLDVLQGMRAARSQSVQEADTDNKPRPIRARRHPRRFV
jgi:hypothetical protein